MILDQFLIAGDHEFPVPYLVDEVTILGHSAPVGKYQCAGQCIDSTSGQPVAAAVVMLLDARDGLAKASAKAGADGSWSIKGISAPPWPPHLLFIAYDPTGQKGSVALSGQNLEEMT
ncbi:MAG: carboxypeptidase-like regulatory domain-containing protein [Desulfobulbaceae bacterium]|jgi:hypothetical protein|nr:carboxypeptidase-like regulatory domain-containing protein [Desulfobulbaceae bacterium]